MLMHALKHGDRPTWLIPSTAILALYAVAPFNFVIPVLGAVDDMVLVPLAWHYLLRFFCQRTFEPEIAANEPVVSSADLRSITTN